MSENPNPSQKTYHKKATGAALNTVKRHTKEHELKLFGSCFWYVALVIWPSLSFANVKLLGVQQLTAARSYQSVRAARVDIHGD